MVTALKQIQVVVFRHYPFLRRKQARVEAAGQAILEVSMGEGERRGEKGRGLGGCDSIWLGIVVKDECRSLVYPFLISFLFLPFSFPLIVCFRKKFP